VSKIHQVPEWLIETFYVSLLKREAVVRTMGIRIDEIEKSIGFTGGSPEINPHYIMWSDYVSVQEFIDRLQDGIEYE